jgi:hypothetical protein
MTYKVQIDDLTRDATEEEIIAIESLVAEEAQRLAELEVKSEAKAKLFDRLGLTADEAAILLG